MARWPCSRSQRCRSRARRPATTIPASRHPAGDARPGRTGVTVKPIITVGDTLPGGYTFESIPDGIALKTRGQGRVDVWVNHETSTVPFPFTPATGVGFNDFTNAMLSKLSLEPAQRRRPEGRLRDPERGELPALLLELPRG